MLDAGGADRVVAAADLVPDSKRSAALELVLGEAHTALGDLEHALDCLGRSAGGAGAIPSSVGWRLAKAQLLQDDLEGAVRTCERTVVDPSRPDEEALLCAWTASAYYRRGDAERRGPCPNGRWGRRTDPVIPRQRQPPMQRWRWRWRRSATSPARTCTSAGPSTPPSAARMCSSSAASGTTEARCSSTRVSTPRRSTSSRPLELAELGGFPQLLGLALMNRGLCRWCLGRLDEANADYEAAVGVYRQSGTSEISYALIGRGDVHRERGELALARRFYEEGLAIAERSGDRQGLVPGLYQLAKVIVDDEPERADELVERAVSYGWPDRAWALNAARLGRARPRRRRPRRLGRARSRGLGPRSRRPFRAGRGARAPRLHGRRAGPAAGRPRRGALAVAGARQRGARGSGRARARAALERGRGTGGGAPGGPQASAARHPGQPLRAGRAAADRRLGDGGRPAIETLGGFRIHRAGEAVPPPAGDRRRHVTCSSS